MGRRLTPLALAGTLVAIGSVSSGCSDEPASCGGIAVADQLREHGRHDLPGQAVPVLQPATLLRLLVTADGQLGPEAVNLVLRIAHHLQRDGLAEFEVRPTVERGERLPFELESHGEGADEGGVEMAFVVEADTLI